MSILVTRVPQIIGAAGYLVGMKSVTIFMVLAAALSVPIVAQPLLFGSIDDPEELGRRAPWLAETSVAVFGGFSLIGPAWRSATRVRVLSASSSFSTSLSFALRAGSGGIYEPDIDEPYDALRTLNHIRVQNNSGSYLRVGPLERTRLDVGQIVNFHNSLASWNERRLGVETSVANTVFHVDAFSDELNFRGLVGGTFSVSPFGGQYTSPFESVTISASGVADRSRQAESTEPVFRALSFSVRMETWRSGAFSLFPFVSYARIESGGDGYFFGADLTSENFIDTARLHFRVAFHINGDGFLPGIVGPFWSVQNAGSRIVMSDPDPESENRPVLLPREFLGAPRNRALESELRLLLFERFELWYRFVRNFDYSSTGQFNARIFVRARQFRLGIAYDRGNVGNFFTLFDNLGDRTLLRFETSYRVFDVAWILVEARYTYNRIPDDGVLRLYEVERRFDPLVGVRILL